MGKQILDDELWALIEPLLPPPKPRRFRNPGRKPVPDRAALTGILFVLKSRIRWNELPQEMGCRSGVSCWRRLRTGGLTLVDDFGANLKSSIERFNQFARDGKDP